MPNALLSMLMDHRDLGVHTELMSDGVIDLVEAGVITGTRKKFRRGKMVTTLASGIAAAVRLPARELGGGLRPR